MIISIKYIDDGVLKLVHVEKYNVYRVIVSDYKGDTDTIYESKNKEDCKLKFEEF